MPLAAILRRRDPRDERRRRSRHPHRRRHRGHRVFQRTSQDKLYAAFKPVVSQKVGEVGATRAYKDLMGKYESMPMVSKQSVDLDDYVTRKSLDGVFDMVGRKRRRSAPTCGAQHRPAQDGVRQVGGAFGLRRRPAGRRTRTLPTLHQNGVTLMRSRSILVVVVVVLLLVMGPSHMLHRIRTSPPTTRRHVMSRDDAIAVWRSKVNDGQRERIRKPTQCRVGLDQRGRRRLHAGQDLRGHRARDDGAVLDGRPTLFKPTRSAITFQPNPCDDRVVPATAAEKLQEAVYALLKSLIAP